MILIRTILICPNDAIFCSNPNNNHGPESIGQASRDCKIALHPLKKLTANYFYKLLQIYDLKTFIKDIKAVRASDAFSQNHDSLGF